MDANIQSIKAFLLVNRVSTLNVAGHRDEVAESFSENITALVTNDWSISSLYTAKRVT